MRRCQVLLALGMGLLWLACADAEPIVYIPLLGFFAIADGGGDEVSGILALLYLAPLAFAPAVGLLST